MLLRHYEIADLVRRVVGVGSVGTRCQLAVLQDGDGNALVLQAKEAGASVLAQYGGIEQPPEVVEGIAEHGEGWRVVGMQRVLQAASDPFLGHLRAQTDGSRDYYVRQFHDMKGSFDTMQLADSVFLRYALACATTLARSHSQSRTAASITGYLGSGRAASTAILDWAEGYAEVSRADWELFRRAQAGQRSRVETD